MIKAFSLAFIYAYCFSFSSNAKAIGKIAIIIDDIGNNQYHQSFSTLPQHITFSILPFTPYAKKIANSAHQKKREVLVHIPMQAYSHNNLLGKGALTQRMTKQEHQETLQASLMAVPYAIGVNNHMGSKLTEKILPMRWTMELLYQQGFFFVDSRTSNHSIAESSAIIAGLPALRRHVFLDNERTQEAMEKRFQEAIKHSHQSLHTIIIAHPYPETLQYLSQRLAKPNKAYQLVKLSQLISVKQRITLQRKKVEYQQVSLASSERSPTQHQ